MEIRLVDVEYCGGAVVTVTGQMLAARVVEVRILPFPGSPPDESDKIKDAALAGEDSPSRDG